MNFKVLSILSVIIILPTSCKLNEPVLERFAGFTQGTTYSIIYEPLSESDPEEIKQAVEKIFNDIDFSLSLYNDSSVIARINRNETETPDAYFKEIFVRSKEIWELTDGAFDITVGPLVTAWGFGPDARKSFNQSRLDTLLALVGFDKIMLIDDLLVKSDPDIVLDLNAIAQGYTVDIVYRYFDSQGFQNYLIEIGGEVRVKGQKGSEYWKIGIDKPADDNVIPGENLQAIIRLKDKALATSGNYRKFYIENGIKYSHTIDPRTGYPAKNRLLSATIICGDCTAADGIATACMVMGTEKSIEFIERNREFEAYFIFSDEEGKYLSWVSKNLERWINEE